MNDPNFGRLKLFDTLRSTHAFSSHFPESYQTPKGSSTKGGWHQKKHRWHQKKHRWHQKKHQVAPKETSTKGGWHQKKQKKCQGYDFLLAVQILTGWLRQYRSDLGECEHSSRSEPSKPPA